MKRILLLLGAWPRRRWPAPRALCIATGACTGSPAQIIAKLRSDAQTYNQANPGYGFNGDPGRPVSGRYYGYLTRAGAY